MSLKMEKTPWGQDSRVQTLKAQASSRPESKHPESNYPADQSPNVQSRRSCETRNHIWPNYVLCINIKSKHNTRGSKLSVW